MSVAERLPGSLPVVCTNPLCGFTFVAPNPVGGGGFNIIFEGNLTSCPKCGSVAKYSDWHTDNKGKFHLGKLLEEVKKVGDKEKLESVKLELEAANDDYSADDLVEALEELSPTFKQYESQIKALPLSTIKAFVQMLLVFIPIVISYQALIVSTKSLDVSNQQLELSREQFEYQKEKDAEEQSQKEAAEREIRELKLRMESLEREFEQRLNNREDNTSSLPKPRPLLKAKLRNKPCPCGSGIKAKKCHPRGFA
ncbi:SEC-C domain-containing protein [Vibrio furnissii]|uniref:SEC-C domain-containing protein n=1 Tax=Vibrio furnissii TaxID=29494 RepID=UPI001C9CA805|nr:SEC-C metal-binding domain-containing protein [Vibrio furnissii]MBY8067934.1 SEC-C domain-containing protein [Vibrio fluvialis]WJG23733.1 SEC-C metal-binding domain-containing protein [Vibrio furnissii]